MMKKFKLINKSNNMLPEYARVGDAGMDLRANIGENKTIVLKPLSRILIPTGIYIALEDNYEAQIRPRSGLAANYGITVLNTPGTIDSNYRGEIRIILINLSDEDFTINHGDRIAQMVISKYEKIEWESVDEFDEITERGDGGFGHTGVK
jgi:dUTP pyrophosphatase